MRPTSRTEFAIAIICALTLEADAVEALFDDPYDRLSRYYSKHPSDSNTYINGRIGKHNVVLSYMPGMGKGSAASVAANLRVSYPEVRLALVVGICGGAPSPPEYPDIFLGDIIISNSVIEYDFGKQYPDGFKRKTDVLDTLGRPDQEIRGFLKALDARRTRMEYQERILHHLHALQQKDGLWRHPQIDDVLFKSSYVHKHYEKTSSCVCDGYSICEAAPDTSCADIGCKDSEVRRRRSEAGISMHIGRVASADTVMKSAQHRDEITEKERTVGFEMEGAGVWDNIPCIIIKGVCDYADSHKDKSWQKYAAATGASAAKAFLEDWRPTQQEDTSKARHLIIPFGRNPRFVGRQDELLELEKLMSTPDGPKRLAMPGLGGVGKTQVALELVYRVRDRKPHCSIFWIPCISYEAVEQAFMAIAETVEGERRKKSTDIKQWFKTYFSQTDSDWVIIFDNADDMEMWTKGDNSTPPLTDFIPFNNRGHVIFTTRNGELAVDLVSSDMVHIHALDKTSGVEFLDKSLRKDVDRDYQAMLSLLEQLTFLPLALSQAVAYINKKRISISDYSTLFMKQEKDVVDLLSKDFGDNHRYKDVQNPVAKTWVISFRQIQSLNPLAAEYLSLMACVNPRYIPRIFLAPEFNMEMVDAVGLLGAFSFIALQPGNISLQSQNCFITLHRLVHLATRNWMRMEGRLPAHICKAAGLLEQGLRMDQHWQECLPHAVYLLSDRVLYTNVARNLNLLENVMRCLVDYGGYAKARELLRIYAKAGYYEVGPLLLRVIMMRRGIAGLDGHPEAICLLHDLASIHLVKGRLGEAETLGVLALQQRIELLGPEYPDTLCSLETLACTYRQQGQRKKAEEVDVLVLEAWKNAPRPQSFGFRDVRQRRIAGWEETQRLHLQVIEIRKRVLGPEHRLTLIDLASLTREYYVHGQWEEAEKVGMEVMEGQKKVLGAQHPQTIHSMQILSLVYSRQGRLQEAAELQATVMEEAGRMVDQERPSSMIIMHKIAHIWKGIGKAEEAKALLEKCAQLGQRVLEPDHPYTMQCSDELRRWASKDQVG